MKATMKNWIDFANEVREAVNIEIPDGQCSEGTYIDNKLIAVTQETGGFSIHYSGLYSSCQVQFYAGIIESQVSVQFTDNYTNPTDFDALLDEAKAWWNEFKTSDHPILIDNQIRKTLHHENTTDQQ
jgi:hypothetical protein